jgi:limonene-1,2-epoxide hydrolase
MKTRLTASLLLAGIIAPGLPAFAGAAASPAENAKVVAGFIASWGDHDVDRTLSFVTADCFYHNMPLEPIRGRTAMRKFLAPFFAKDAFSAPFSLTPEILHVVAKGDMVFQERVDHYVIGKAHYDIPDVGVYQLRGGKIASWEDYFDMGQFQPVVLLMQALMK